MRISPITKTLGFRSPSTRGNAVKGFHSRAVLFQGGLGSLFKALLYAFEPVPVGSVGFSGILFVGTDAPSHAVKSIPDQDCPEHAVTER